MDSRGKRSRPPLHTNARSRSACSTIAGAEAALELPHGAFLERTHCLIRALHRSCPLAPLVVSLFPSSLFSLFPFFFFSLFLSYFPIPVTVLLLTYTPPSILSTSSWLQIRSTSHRISTRLLPPRKPVHSVLSFSLIFSLSLQFFVLASTSSSRFFVFHILSPFIRYPFPQTFIISSFLRHNVFSHCQH